jgi:hypothetical protein
MLERARFWKHEHVIWRFLLVDIMKRRPGNAPMDANGIESLEKGADTRHACLARRGQSQQSQSRFRKRNAMHRLIPVDAVGGVWRGDKDSISGRVTRGLGNYMPQALREVPSSTFPNEGPSVLVTL